MKQTAVEWLISKLPTVNDNDPYLTELIEQAKEMEKRRWEDAYKKGKKPSTKTFIEYYYERTLENKFTITIRITNDNINVTKIN